MYTRCGYLGGYMREGKIMKLLKIITICVLLLSASLAMAGRESKEKAGTEDINIGVGELQETGHGTEDINIGVGELQENRGGTQPGGSGITTDDGDETKAPILLPGVQMPPRRR